MVESLRYSEPRHIIIQRVVTDFLGKNTTSPLPEGKYDGKPCQNVAYLRDRNRRQILYSLSTLHPR